MPSVLVTGGCGFIGSHVVDEFIRANYRVVVIDKAKPVLKKNLNGKAKYYLADLADKSELAAILKKERPEIISFHASNLVSVQASIKNPLQAFTDILFISNIIDLAREFKIRQFIFPSSANVYAKNPQGPVAENAPLEPLSPYGLTKLTIERYLQHVGEIFDLPIVIFRYFNVYGPRQHLGKTEGIVPIIINSLLNQKVLSIFGDGSQTRDFVYVADVARANVLAAKKNANGLSNLGSGKNTSINTLIKIAEKELGVKARINYLPGSTQIINSLAEITRIKKTLGWQPQTSLTVGLQKTAAYYLKKF